ncbi:MAG: FG-GAP-like repeat-containing protein [Acidobacteriota bacterium]
MDAGDAVTYTLEIAHLPASTADAHSLVISDPLPAGVEWVSSATVSSDCAGLSVDDSGAPSLVFSLPDLPLAAGSCQISFGTRIADSVQPTEGLVNLASLQYDSQRTFTAGETRRRVTNAKSEITVLAPGLVKIVTSSSLDATGVSFHRADLEDLAIGESVDYRLTLVFPEGRTENAVVVDSLPAGASGVLEVVAASIVEVGGRLVTELAGAPVRSDEALGDGLDDTVTFDFGTVTNAADGEDDEGDRIVLSVTARAVDAPANLDGAELVNEAELSFSSGAPLRDTASVDVVEPDVVIVKTLGPVDDRVVTVSVEVRNDGTSPAYDLEVEDLLEGAQWETVQLAMIGIPAGFLTGQAPGPAAGDVVLTLRSDPGALPPLSSLEPGESAMWTFTVPVRETNPPLTSLSNTATNTTTSSLPGPEPAERSGPQGSDTALLGLPELSADKTASLLEDADQSSSVSPGDTLRYTVELRNDGQGPASQIEIRDTPDANTALVPSSVVAPAGAAVVSGDQAGDLEVVVQLPALGAGETASVSFEVEVLPVAAGVVDLTNQAQVSLRELEGLVSDDPSTGAPGDPTVVGLDAAPDLTLTKGDDGDAAPGAVVVYTLSYSNDGTQEALGVLLEETVPENARFDEAASLPSVWSCDDASGPGTPCLLTVGDLAVGEGGTARFAVRLVDSLPAGVDALENVATVRDDGSQGPDLDPSDNRAERLTPVDAEPIFDFRKSVDAPVAIPGVPLLFDLEYSNVGFQDATGVVLEETVPANGAFDAAASQPQGWSCADGSGPGTACQLALGNLDAGESGSAVFAVRTAQDAADGALLSNTASIRDDGANGPQPTSAEETAAVQIKTLRFTKTRLSGETVAVGQEVTYRVVARLPEGLSLNGVVIRDDLPEELWAVRQDFAQVLPGVVFSGSLMPVLEDGRALIWDLGTVANLDTDPATDEIFETTYTTQVRNVPAAADGESFDNAATWSADGELLASASASARVVEPRLTLRQTLEPTVASAGDVVSVRLTLAHGPGSFVPAYDLEVVSVLDPAFTYLGNLRADNGPLPQVDVSALPTVRLTWADLSNEIYNPSNPVVVSFDVETSAGGRIDSVADLTWTSRPGEPGLADPTEETTGERTGDAADPGGAVNDYRDRDAAQLNNQLLYGFEDLKNDDVLFNDFDYNDWLIEVTLEETLDDAGNWRRLEFGIEGLGRGAGFNHLPWLDVGVEGPVVFTVQRFDSAGALIFEQTQSSDGEFLRGIQLFADTWDTLPPWNQGNFPFAANTDPAQTSSLTTRGQTARVVVEIGESSRNPRVADDPATAHLNETFNYLVGPWIRVLDTGEEIHFRWRGRGATQDLVTADLYGPQTPLLGFPLDQVRAFESLWRWPIEREPIWDAYPNFVDFILSGETASTDWRLQPAAGVIWPVDVAPETAPPLLPAPAGDTCGSVAFDHAFGSPVSASPAIGDLDADGDWEVVSAEFLGALVIHDETGATVRVIEPAGVGGGILQSSASATLADVDGDTDLEILRGFDDGSLIAFHHDGTEAARWQLPASLKSTAVTADLEGDGDLEIFVLAGDAKLHGLRAEGGTIPGFPVSVGGLEDVSNNFVLQPSPAVADVVPGGDLEIVAVGNLGEVFVLTSSGGVVAGWPYALGTGAALASPAVGDLDGDGGLEIVVADDGGGVFALTAGGGLLWHAQRVLGGPSSPALADLDGGSSALGQTTLEVVIGSMDGKVYAFDAAGEAVAGWPVTTGSAVLASPSAGDVDGDGAAEVFVGSFDTRVYGWSGDGRTLAGFGDSAFPCSLGAAIFSSPALGDIDLDGHVEVLMGSYSRRLHRMTVAGTVAAGLIPWPEFRGGSGHGGSSSALEPRQPVDLAISLGNGLESVQPGESFVYALVLENAGPNGVSGALLTAEWDADLGPCRWTCSSQPADLCPQGGGGVGNLDLAVDLPISGRLSVEARCTVDPGFAGDAIASEAEVRVPADRYDTNPANNRVSDVDANAQGLIFVDGFESGDTGRWATAAGGR